MPTKLGTTTNRTIALAIAVAATAAAGCDIEVKIDVNGDGQVNVDLGDFDVTCAGSGSRDADNGHVTWTKAVIDDDRCQVDVAWDGTLIDMQELRAKADAQAQGATLTLQNIDLTFDDVALRDQRGATVTPPTVPDWEAHFYLGGELVGDFGGTDVTSLLNAPLTFTLSAPALALANQAFTDAVSLRGSAIARLVFEMSDVAAFAAAGGGPLLQFHFNANVKAAAKKDLL